MIDIWAEWSKINVASGFTGPIFWRLVRTASQHQDPAAIQAAVISLSKLHDIAEARLASHAFIAGDDLTMADIQFGHLLYRYYDMAIEHPDHPALRRYYDRLTARPAYQEHVMISYEELRVV